jgi:hypothetical protein
MLRRLLKISVALGAIGSLALAALLAFLWCEHIRPLVLPMPTGHFDVGRVTYTWVDDAVPEPLSPSGAEKETVVAWMWYPAQLSTQSQHAEYFPSAWQAGTPVLAKHSKSFSLIDCISVGVDRMQRNFEPMRKQVEAWQKSELRRYRESGHLRGVRGGATRSPEAPCPHRAWPLLRAKVRGIQDADDLESFECVYFRIQGTGADPAVQGNREAG